jgi:glycosyltransferase involved in cell wall biosynthesis
MEIIPKIAVVVPLYNKAENIRATIESILNQDLSPNEIIIVDDGSTDGGADIVEDYKNRGVTLIRQSNQGVSAARNAGVNAADADYVAFIDADDLWESDHLSVMIELIMHYPGAGLYSSAYKICRDGLIYTPKSKFPKSWQGIIQNFFYSDRDDLSRVCSSTA